MNISGVSTNYGKQQAGFGMAVKVKPNTQEQAKALESALHDLYRTNKTEGIPFDDYYEGAVLGSNLVRSLRPERNPYIQKTGEILEKINPLNWLGITDGSGKGYFNNISKTGAHIFEGHTQEAENAIAGHFATKGYKVEQTPFRKAPDVISEELIDPLY